MQNKMVGLEPECCGEATHRFRTPEPSYVDLVAHAWAAGNAPGNLWVDCAERPTYAFLWDLGSCCYLAGDLTGPAVATELASLVRRVLWPKARIEHGLFLKVEAATPLDVSFISESFPGASLRASDRVLLVSPPVPTDPGPEPGCDPPAPPALPDPDAALRWVDRDLLRSEGLANHDRLLQEIRCCWPSVDRFEQQGFGASIVGGGELRAWCTGEYRTDQRIGIGIETVSEHQGKGYATAAATAFLRRCHQEGLTAYWDAWAANSASIRVAEKVGLRPVTRYQAYAGVLAP
ncbi:MAG TPA: GNAT family N-acetyltransferase [Armatimonadota bacterium]